MFTPTLRCECAQPASDRVMRKWCIDVTLVQHFIIIEHNGNNRKITNKLMICCVCVL